MSNELPGREVPRRNDRAALLWFAAVLILLVFAAVGVVIFNSITKRLPVPALNTTTVSQSLVVDKIEKVAKLVSTETTLRDVVIYENTWYGSTKRSLVVVTGKVLAGIDLNAGNSVEVDDKARVITISLPQPSVLGVEITEMKTYDEQRGYWNAFTASDRDAIFQLARDQLKNTSQELKITDTARQSARELLEGMFSSSGYKIEVVYH